MNRPDNDRKSAVKQREQNIQPSKFRNSMDLWSSSSADSLASRRSSAAARQAGRDGNRCAARRRMQPLVYKQPFSGCPFRRGSVPSDARRLLLSVFFVCDLKVGELSKAFVRLSTAAARRTMQVQSESSTFCGWRAADVHRHKDGSPAERRSTCSLCVSLLINSRISQLKFITLITCRRRLKAFMKTIF